MMDISDLRGQIRDIDADIIGLLAKRFGVVRQIGAWKKQHEMPIEDLSREAEMQQFYQTIAVQEGIDASAVRPIFEVIVGEAKKLQNFSS